jgi:hypothetical protein
VSSSFSLFFNEYSNSSINARPSALGRAREKRTKSSE